MIDLPETSAILSSIVGLLILTIGLLVFLTCKPYINNKVYHILTKKHKICFKFVKLKAFNFFLKNSKYDSQSFFLNSSFL